MQWCLTTVRLSVYAVTWNTEISIGLRRNILFTTMVAEVYSVQFSSWNSKTFRGGLQACCDLSTVYI